ncbi:MAG: DUF4386 domain-containing protein [Spirochaetia bacterium]
MEKRPSRILGAAFLFQFITSLFSGIALSGNLFVAHSMEQTLLNIAANPLLARGYIFVDMLTAMGIVFLGVMLYLALRHENEKMALTAFGLYILEIALLAVSKGDAFALIHLSSEYAAHPSEALLAQGASLFHSMEFAGVNLHMLVFCTATVLFHLLLLRSKIVPLFFPIWGLVSLSLVSTATIASLFGITLPFALYLLYVPFEFVIGLWILIRGVNYKA